LNPALIPIVLLLALAAAGCSLGGGEERVIYVTATPYYDEQGQLVIPPTETPSKPTPQPIKPTPNPTRAVPQSSNLYVVQPGDTLGTIATQYGVTVDELLALNALGDANVLEVGQTLNVPGGQVEFAPSFKLIPDSELVYSPGASSFSVTAFAKFQQGFLRAYSETIDDKSWSGVEIIDFVARSYSINPRLLLALLEYRSDWITDPYPESDQAEDYPMGLVSTGREGLYRQMLDAADALNTGYYGWKYRGAISLSLGDQRVFYASDVNAGTVGVQYMLSVGNSYAQWQTDIGPDGFYQTYLNLFGDPFEYAVEPLVPANLQQPTLTLPFAPGEEWVFTGGPHGGYNSGSAWSAVDFAPPKPPDELVNAQGSCYISPQWVTAVADGVIARSGSGYIILDLDGDGDEHTGWTLVYLHMDDYEVIKPGTQVKAGDRLGHPSCMGGFSNGTHLHFSRRYNGEWLPVECNACAPGVSVPAEVLGEWTMHGYAGQEYQGYMTRDGDDGYRQADQTRDFEQNKVMW
jgi:murein DD-endopeptidase MepM/ murein hydrolase activator NlpD